MYQLMVDGQCIKEYPFKIQAITYCCLKGFVYSGWDDWERGSIGSVLVLDPRVKIVKRKD